jgi:flagellar motor switch protein FliG
MPGAQKAAILLVALGERLGGEILKQLNDEEVKSVSKAIARLGQVGPSQTEAVLEELCQSALTQGGRGGFDSAKRMVANGFGPEGAKRIAEHLPQGGVNKNIESLQKADPYQLSRFVEGEHPQTIALILSHLSAVQAASLLTNLPAAIRSDIVVRIAELDRVSPDVVTRISVVITDKMKSIGEMKAEPRGGPRSVAEILNRMDSAISDEILDNITDQQNLVDAIRHYMFVFDDLLLLDATSMKEVVAKIDRKLLTIALKGTSDQLKNHFLQCMSQRGAENIREEMEAAGPTRIKDVEAPQHAIHAVVQQMESEGVLSMKGGGGDQYVV